MARLPSPLDSLTPEAQAIADRIGAKRGGVVGPFVPLMHAPVLAGRIGDLGEYLRFDSTLPGGLREIAVLVVVRSVRQPLEFVAHSAVARNEGVDDAVIELIHDQGDLSTLPHKSPAPLRVIEHVLAFETIPADLHAEVEEQLGTTGLVELVSLVGYYLLISGVLFAFDFRLPKDLEQPF